MGNENFGLLAAADISGGLLANLSGGGGVSDKTRKQMESLGYFGDDEAEERGTLSKDGKVSAGPRRATRTHADEDSKPKEFKTVDTKNAKRKAPVASRPLPMGGRRNPGSWMRKVWFRTAAVENYFGTGQNVHDAIENGERLLLQNPDSRLQHSNLIQALSYAGQLERAEEVARAWIERDRLDPEALSYLADIFARKGMRDESIRLLSGVVDLRADDKELHLRLAKAYDRAGERRFACAHRVMLADLDPRNSKIVMAAVRCENANRRGDRADAILANLDVTVRGRIERSSQGNPPRERTSGDLRINATWTGSDDLDIAIITPTGKRISWMGGHKRVFAQNVKSTGRETLGLTRIRKGRYLIEISRTNATDSMPVRGEVVIELLGRKQRISFEVHDKSAIVGRAVVRMESRMEPI
ncbi:MAG: hypothetical protein JKY56_24940 [Kofleriaceae bacterium]|nr:hypothetical protein [Kofleriaceae bacterium]